MLLRSGTVADSVFHVPFQHWFGVCAVSNESWHSCLCAHLCIAEKILLIFYLSCYPWFFSIHHCLLWSHIAHCSVPLRCVIWGQVLQLSFGLDETPGSPNGSLCSISVLTLQTHQDCYLWAAFLRINVSFLIRTGQKQFVVGRKGMESQAVICISFLCKLGAGNSDVPSLLGGKRHSPVNFIFSQGWWVLFGAGITLPHPCAFPFLLSGILCSPSTGLKSNEKCQRRGHGTFKKEQIFPQACHPSFYYSPQWSLPLLNTVSYDPVTER